jgi:hypothetical protein
MVEYDINTQAYNWVRESWIWQGIWSNRWGILPGMFWKHELPFDADEEEVDFHIKVGQKKAKETAGDSKIETNSRHCVPAPTPVSNPSLGTPEPSAMTSARNYSPGNVSLLPAMEELVSPAPQSNFAKLWAELGVYELVTPDILGKKGGRPAPRSCVVGRRERK